MTVRSDIVLVRATRVMRQTRPNPSRFSRPSRPFPGNCESVIAVEALLTIAGCASFFSLGQLEKPALFSKGGCVTCAMGAPGQ